MKAGFPTLETKMLPNPRQRAAIPETVAEFHGNSTDFQIVQGTIMDTYKLKRPSNDTFAGFRVFDS